jgi:hypothetical protein
LVPVQSPDAVQEVAFVLDHVIVVDWPSVIAGGEAEIVTVGRGGTGFTVTVAVPNFVESCLLAALTVAVPAVFGAVKTPDEEMVPIFTDQVTEGSKLPVP